MRMFRIANFCRPQRKSRCLTKNHRLLYFHPLSIFLFLWIANNVSFFELVFRSKVVVSIQLIITQLFKKRLHKLQ